MKPGKGLFRPYIIVSLLLSMAWASPVPADGGVKIRVSDPNVVRAIVEGGGRIVADYGSFQLLDTDAATAEALRGRDAVDVRDDDKRILLNVGALDTTRHPTIPADRLSEHTHILVVSEFCRTPQINLSGGRDHYPNGSALVISPRFRGNFSYGSSDPDQLLPRPAGMFGDGMRAIAPPDVLATFLSAFGVDPRRYMRDGEAVRALLRA